MSDNLGARLRNAKESLSAWYDRLNTQWADAEKTLRSFNLSQDVWTSFKAETHESDDGTPSRDVFSPTYSRDVEHCLAFLKQDGEWKICYALGEVGDSDSYSPRPVRDCSLEVRMLALEGLPKLLHAIVEEAEAESTKLEVALGAAAESLASFKAAMELKDDS
ncbi:MAG TPA: hypothetical protein VGN42_04265 [Pirellulales bacterium]|jgi:hypothetical protein|nr:hypothetical protein [Pirellulales bacterium]